MPTSSSAAAIPGSSAPWSWARGCHRGAARDRPDGAGAEPATRPAAKWQACHDAEGDEKYAVCNAIDSDPRARTARLLLGSDPHSVLEGLLIGAYAVGATRCFVCVNAEYDGGDRRRSRRRWSR